MQASSYQTLQNYLRVDSDFGVRIGPVLKALCILVWSVTWVNDLFSASKLMAAAFKLQGGSTVLSSDASGQKQIVRTRGHEFLEFLKSCKNFKQFFELLNYVEFLKIIKICRNFNKNNKDTAEFETVSKEL